jgi:hypothetical protein
MFVYNKIIAILIFSFLTKVVSDDSYFPCKSYISFSYDDSFTLSNEQFKTQMNFIKNAIENFNHPERLRVEGNYGGEFNWNSPLSMAQMQSLIDSAQQSSNPYSLLQQAASLLTSVEILNTVTDPISALIFISDTSDSALKNADRWFAKLQNVEITFVLLGTNVDSLKLRNLTTNFVYWPDLTQSQPDNWDLISYHAFGCRILPSTAPPTTSKLTTPTGGNYIPCQSWIHFGVDGSNALLSNYFVNQLNFISNAIGNLNHPERIQVVGMYNQPVPWNSGLSLTQIQAAVAGLPQSGSYMLRLQFAALATNLPNVQTTSYPIGALIFISDTSDQALANANVLFPQLSAAKITFVLLGPNPNSTKLTQFSSNFIYWTDLSKPQPDNWDASSYAAYGC